jgi:hypothetical protein
MYPLLRTIHLLCGVLSLPMLLMYGVSAVQMAHSNWFSLKPAVTERQVPAAAGETDGRRLARNLMRATGLRGEITSVSETPDGFLVRLTIPGTVHEIRYNRASGTADIRTSVAGTLGFLNRLHHAAGFWHDWSPMKVWALLVAVVSFATVGLAVTGLWMWWLRRQERVSGLILLLANVAFAVVVLSLLRASGP